MVELVERAGLVKGTVRRLTVSLENHGLISRVADAGW